MEKSDKWLKDFKKKAAAAGARVYFMELEVDYSQPFIEAAIAASSQSFRGDDDIFKVANFEQYVIPDSEKVKKKELLIFFNWPAGEVPYKNTVKWGIENGLEQKKPHAVFATSQNLPKLDQLLEVEGNMFLIETTGCTLNNTPAACYTVWARNPTKRKAQVFAQATFCYGSDWYLFGKTF